MAGGKHRAGGKGKSKDNNGTFQHPAVKGETDPVKIKEMLDRAKADNDAAMDKIIKDTRGPQPEK